MQLPSPLRLSIGIIIGLLLLPNGKDIGYAMGDYYLLPNATLNSTKLLLLPHRTSASSLDPDISEVSPPSFSHKWGIFFTVLGTVLLDFNADACQSENFFTFSEF